VVGPLQLDVLASRMDKEYGVPIRYEPAPFVTARWIVGDDKAAIEKFLDSNRTSVAEDRDGALVYLARNAWALDQAKQYWPAL
jgi:peptide chain release factor 3